MVEIYSRPLVSQFSEREYQKSPIPYLKNNKIYCTVYIHYYMLYSTVRHHMVRFSTVDKNVRERRFAEFVILCFAESGICHFVFCWVCNCHFVFCRVWNLSFCVLLSFEFVILCFAEFWICHFVFCWVWNFSFCVLQNFVIFRQLYGRRAVT